ncbi:hypothetical protein BVX98_01575 [bacterium F11]|nr:hypothetical protein BVX98_01575 [bacterium F11]
MGIPMKGIAWTVLLLFFSTPLIVNAGGTVSFGETEFGLGSLTNLEVESSSLKTLEDWSISNAPFEERLHMGFSIDQHTGHYLVFGGHDHLGRIFGDTWIYHPHSNWSQSNPTGPPTPRYGHGLVWIGSHFLLFGGKNSTNDVLNDTWIYDVDLSTWTNLNLSFSPSPRAFFSLSYDPDLNQVILFGGEDELGRLMNTQTWVFDIANQNWTSIQTNPSPPSRRESSMAYDSINQQTILFGGRAETWNPSDIFNDTWAFNGNAQTWDNQNPIRSPNPIVGGTLSFDQQYEQVVLYGGRETPTWYSDHCEFYDFKTNTWARWNTPETPAGRYGHGMIYDTLTNKGKILGGKRDIGTNALWTYTLHSSGTWISPQKSVTGHTFFMWESVALTPSGPLPEGTSVYFRLSSSEDGTNFTNFLGPDGTTLTSYILTSTKPVMIGSAHLNHRYIKMMAELVSKHFLVPTKISDFRLTYNQAPSIPIPKSPADQTRTNTVRPTFKWNLSADNDGLDDTPLLYHWQASTTSTFVTISTSVEDIPRDISDVSFVPPFDLESSTWFWRVRAKDKDAFYGEWSPPFSLLIDTTTPPGPVKHISAGSGPGNGEISLTWTFPGDDDGRLENGKVIVHFSSVESIASENAWSRAEGERILELNADPNEILTSVVTGLMDNTLYHLAIKTKDENGNLSPLSQVSPSAFTLDPPKPVQSISGYKGPQHGEITLEWIYPPENGHPITNGLALIRYSQAGPLSDDNSWINAEGEGKIPIDANPGEKLISIVSGLAPGTTYYFALKVRAPSGLTSNISSVSPLVLTNAPPFPVTHLVGEMGPEPGQIHLSWIYPEDDDAPSSPRHVHIRYTSDEPIYSESAWRSAMGKREFPLNAIPGEQILSLVTGLSNGTAYYFSLRTQDALGGLSPISLESPYLITNGPPIVNLLLPQDGSVLENPTSISWTVTDPNPGSLWTIDVRLSADEGKTYPMIIVENLPKGSTFYRWDISQLPNGLFYRLRVQASDQQGLMGMDSSRNNLFRFDFSTPPHVSFDSVPSENQVVTGAFPLTWVVSNPSPYISYSYDIFLSNDQGLSYQKIISTSVPNATFDSTDWSNDFGYKLKLVAQDSGTPPLSGSEESGLFYIFNSRPPHAFNLINPLSDDMPSIFDLRFIWEEAIDPDGDPILYSLVISTEGSFRNPTIIPNLKETTYSPPLGTIHADQRYHWRVSAIDFNQGETKSPPHTFMISTTKAVSPDDFLFVEILSELPQEAFIRFEDGWNSFQHILEEAKRDSYSNRLINIFSYPVWDVQLSDLHHHRLPVDSIRAKLTFRLDENGLIPQPEKDLIIEGHLKIAELNKQEARWQVVTNQSNGIDSNQEISAITEGLRPFSVLGSIPPPALLSGVTNVPNPFSAGEEVTRIRYILNQDSKMTVRIYNLLGDLVRILTFPLGSSAGRGDPLGRANEIIWDGKNQKGQLVSNGVYLAEIAANSPLNKEKVIRKIGVLK